MENSQFTNSQSTPLFVDKMRGTHLPVLLNEVMEWMNLKPGDCIVDGTVGGGGHAEAILEKLGADGKYVAIDRDEKTLARAKERLQKYEPRVLFVHGVFSDLPQILQSLKIEKVQGVLVDLGVSSFQLDEAERGFSFMKEGPLDMRMDPSTHSVRSGQALPEESWTAADIVNEYSEEDLIEIFQKFGGERFSRRIARAIVDFRRDQPFYLTQDLANLVDRVVPPKFKKKASRIHPATRVFQALRIVVNQELEHLEKFLDLDFQFLEKGGRLQVISFHSLEDRIAKWRLRGREDFRVLTKKPVIPSDSEMEENPRSRSAKLRVAEKM